MRESLCALPFSLTVAMRVIGAVLVGALVLLFGSCLGLVLLFGEDWPSKSEIRSAVDSDAFQRLHSSIAQVELLGADSETTCLTAGEHAQPGNAAAVQDSTTFRLMREVGVQRFCIDNATRSVKYIWQSDWEDERGVQYVAPKDTASRWPGMVVRHRAAKSGTRTPEGVRIADPFGETGEAEDWGGGWFYYSTL